MRQAATRAWIFLFLGTGLAIPGRGAELGRAPQAAPAARRRATCTLLRQAALSGVAIDSAELLPGEDGLPERCQVLGFIRQRIGFEIQLPTEWNGKLYFAGNLAFAGGTVDTSVGLSRGYATASTDTGHQGDIFDATWALDDRPAEKDYGYRAVHETAVAAKALIERYYGQAPRHAYMDGCSKGGQEGLREAEQFPEDFDGIAAGAPTVSMTGFAIAANWNMRALFGSSEESVIPVGKLDLIGDAVLAACDGIDGLVDGLVDDPRRCDFRPATLLCRGDDAPECLTAVQVEVLEKLYAGPSDSSGRHLYPGLSMGGEKPDFNHLEWDAYLFGIGGFPAFAMIEQDQFLRYLAFPTDDPEFDWRTFDVDRDPQRMKLMGSILNAEDPDLASFRKAGGRLILWQGWSDPSVAPLGTIDYYERVRRALGGRRPAENTARLFLAPGMSHCFSGPGPNTFDVLTPLERWVEQGIAPTSIVATHFDEEGNVDRTRPLCAYPRVARYVGGGSIDDAENFRCVDPDEEMHVETGAKTHAMDESTTTPEERQ